MGQKKDVLKSYYSKKISKKNFFKNNIFPKKKIFQKIRKNLEKNFCRRSLLVEYLISFEKHIFKNGK